MIYPTSTLFRRRMIYILVSQSELNFSNIWRGHLNAIRQALDINGCSYQQIDVLLAKYKKFDINDIIINIGNHQYLGSQLLNELAESISKVNRTVFFMDDYTAPPPTQIRKAITKSSNLLLTNIKEPITRKSLQHFEAVYIDLNKASFKKLPLKSPFYPNSFIYWGTCRPNREKYFYRYFKPKLYSTYVSTSDRQHKKYSDLYIDYRPLEKIQLPNDLQKYSFTIYMRDTTQPKMAPANRFYEAINAGLPIFFDHECIPQVETPTYIENYIVSKAEQILEKDLQKIQIEQRELWGRRHYRKELEEDLAKIFCTYGIL